MTKRSPRLAPIPPPISLPLNNTTGTTNVISVLVGTKYDSNQNGYIDSSDEFDLENTDVYNFTVTEAPRPPAPSA
ncbi:MAG: hypothetical protein V8S89_04750 [Oscillospiraceae bacterium]